MRRTRRGDARARKAAWKRLFSSVRGSIEAFDPHLNPDAPARNLMLVENLMAPSPMELIPWGTDAMSEQNYETGAEEARTKWANQA